jgi:hypothetical protein
MASRVKNVRCITNALVTAPCYPAALVNGENVYDERIMSMPSMISSSAITDQAPKNAVPPAEIGSHFFFIFNFDNYYHFLYDTLPYLVFYFRLREVDPACKLLIPENHRFLQFQSEVFELLGLRQDDWVHAKDGAVYETLYIPSSLTHGKFPDGEPASRSPPDELAQEIWRRLAYAANTSSVSAAAIYAKKIYVSRRTWVNGDTSNIGTNYTTRRKCENEDEVVKLLRGHGFAEVFCENFSMAEKIKMFAGAKAVVGFIGGGMANCLFSEADCHVGCLETPEFLTINSRFAFSMDHCRVNYLEFCQLAGHDGPFPLYVRVQTPDGVGEIESYNSGTGKYAVKLAGGIVAGFALGSEYEVREYDSELLEPLDRGLNSPFVCDLEKLREWLIHLNI